MSREITISTNDVGEDFLDQLEKIIKIRMDKRKIYGDTYLTDDKTFLLAQLNNKIKRLSMHITNNTSFNDIEKAQDNCLDAAIYALFLNSVIEGKIHDKTNSIS